MWADVRSFYGLTPMSGVLSSCRGCLQNSSWTSGGRCVLKETVGKKWTAHPSPWREFASQILVRLVFGFWWLFDGVLVLPAVKWLKLWYVIETEWRWPVVYWSRVLSHKQKVQAWNPGRSDWNLNFWIDYGQKTTWLGGIWNCTFGLAWSRTLTRRHEIFDQSNLQLYRFGQHGSMNIWWSFAIINHSIDLYRPHYR